MAFEARIILLVLAVVMPAMAEEPAPLEAHAELPLYDMVESSPRVKPRWLEFVSEDRVVLVAGDAPLIVMPHGGPSSHDDYGLDWLAQYFASRGYFVLQPQFRGSDGFGVEHRVAGFGEWGGKMQSDIDDGVRRLIGQGLVDADGVCSVGASYGGYAALVAGAFSPELCRCVVAVAPVSDLRRMLKWRLSNSSSDNWVSTSFRMHFGVDLFENDILAERSPALLAEAFRAPVLLIHGRDDTVVPIDQSRTMYKALRKAGKEAALVTLNSEDHSVRQSETRLKALREIAAFIARHL